MTTGRPRCLGLDVGDRFIGVAISDTLAMTAAGLETIIRDQIESDIEKVAEVARRHHVVEIIIGLPLNMDGTEGMHAQKVMTFGKRLARATGLPVIYEDERTISAVRTLNVQGAESNNSRNDDRQAAAIILQKYLDHKEPPPSA